MASPFDRLMTTIRPHLPGAIDDAIRQELFMVCHEFFRKSNAWREALEFTLSGGQQTAEVMPFAGRIERLMHVVNADGRPVNGANMQEIGIITMPYPANQIENYSAIVALTVSDPLTRDAYPIVPYDIVERYTEVLMHGILKSMMAQPAKPYTNLGLAQLYLNKYNGGTARARNEKNVGNTFGSQKWLFPQTFANRR